LDRLDEVEPLFSEEVDNIEEIKNERN